ncbi:hypothetical protein [Streptomyces sp. 891-h]|uniref:hypothetical protein n=1 Tax=Streptomyces sp. 891-h TaxID=2720714 RepID=UPI001FA95AE0|nr:hypothetical protein [Streptomyces sp. 891-h]UNZ17806.1 hypothetical protein HC362_12785 [Streptomyces sp. 891-h]
MRFWVYFRLLAAIGTIVVMMMWGRRRAEVLREIDQGGLAVLTELVTGLAIPMVLFVALLSIPFEIYVLRRRRSWYHRASIVVIGLNAVLGVGSATTPPESALLAEEVAAYSTTDRALLAAYLFLAFYYLFWSMTIVTVAMVVFFAGAEPADKTAESAQTQVALDAGPTLAQLGLILTAAGNTQAYDWDKGWQQLILPVGVGVGLLVLTLVILAGYRRARS